MKNSHVVIFVAFVGVVTPQPVTAKFASQDDAKGPGVIQAAVHVQGLPMNIQAQSSDKPDDEDAVIALIREWRFQAATKNGQPAAAHSIFTPENDGRPPNLPPGTRPVRKR